MGVLLFEVQTADFMLSVSKTQKICHKTGNNWQFLADLQIFLVNLQASYKQQEILLPNIIE